LNEEERWKWIDPGEETLSLKRQCEALGLARSSWYYRPLAASSEDVLLMNLIDEQYTKAPFYGSRRMVAFLNHLGYSVNRKRIRRLMQKMGIQGVCPGPNTSRRRLEHAVYPYLLRGLLIERPDQVWGVDVTYIRLLRGFAYLVAILDWFSRYVLSWRLSNSLETRFCLEALEEALERATPEILNSDQGCQFTSLEFTGRLLKRKIKISMDSRGRAFDNIFVERLWRSVKYEDVYLKGYGTMPEAQEGLRNYFRFYNKERFHQALNYKTPHEVYFGQPLEKQPTVPLKFNEIVDCRPNMEVVF
jgi:putative transposase